MLDGEVPEKADEVWGFAVPIPSGGRRKWPKELRTMAVERIAAGEGTGDLAQQIEAVKTLEAALTAAAKVSGDISDDEAVWLRKVKDMLLGLERVQSLRNNDVGKAQIDQLIAAQGQRIALADQLLRTGEDSAELRTLEIRQARELAAQELERAGIAQDSERGLTALSRAEYEVKQKHRTADKARQDAFDQFLRTQDDQIAGLEREGLLLGAGNAERIRARALAEAEIEIRDRGRDRALSAEDAALIRAKARAEAEIANERERALRAIRQEATADRLDGRIALAREQCDQPAGACLAGARDRIQHHRLRAQRGRRGAAIRAAGGHHRGGDGRPGP